MAKESMQASKAKKANRLPPALGWSVFGVAVALALAMAITMCVIALR